MTTRDIRAHLREMYGVEVSPDLISRVTDAVAEELAEWQSRPLDAASRCDRIQAITPMLMMYTVAASSSTSYSTRISPACSRQTPVTPHATAPSGYG